MLPFINPTGDAAKEYPADGLAAELIATLSRGSGQRIPSYTSSNAYEKKKVDLRQIGHELGIEFVLEGDQRAPASPACGSLGDDRSPRGGRRPEPPAAKDA